MRRLLSLLPPLFSLVLLAGPLAPVHAAPPKALTWVAGPTGNLRAAVDDEGALWIDSGRPRRLGLLDGHLQQLVVAETSVHLVLEKRAGLSVSSEWRHLDSKGELLGRAVVPAMVESLLPRADGALVLIPGWIYRFKDGAPPTAPIPLPWWESRIRLEADGQSAKGPHIVRGNLSWAVDPENGCTREPWPIDGAYSATRAGIRARQCGLEAPPEQPDRSRLLREDLIKQAITNGDLRSLVAVQADSAEISALRPTKAAAPGPYKTAKNESVQLPASIPRIMPGDLVAYVEGADLPPGYWVGKAESPACLATIVVTVPHPERLALWEETRQRLASAGVMCADSLVLIPTGASLLPNEEKSATSTPAAKAGPAGALYLLVKNVGESQITAEKQATRIGETSVDRIRLDLARLLGNASPLSEVANTLELSPEWTTGSGPGGDLILDVDGSWIASVGFGLARGTPTGLRVQEVPLGGPVEGIRVTADGAYEVTVADQGARVLFEGGSFGVEHGTVVWLGKDLEIEKPRGPILSGWVLSPAGVQAPGSSRTVSLGSPLGRAHAWEGGLIVQTSYGLIGLGQDGRPLWRVSQVKDWAFSDGMLITTGPRGVLGFRPPKRLDGEEATNPDAEQELYDTSESTDPAGGSRKGGPPGPGGGKPGGGKPGGGNPGGGKPGGGNPGGDPGGGKPGGGGR